MFGYVFNFASPKTSVYNTISNLFIFLQQITVYSSFILLILFVITLLLIKMEVSNTKFNVLFNSIKFFNILFSTIILTSVIIKFSIYL